MFEAELQGGRGFSEAEVVFVGSDELRIGDKGVLIVAAFFPVIEGAAGEFN